MGAAFPPSQKKPPGCFPSFPPPWFSVHPAPGGFPGKLLEILGTGNLLKYPPSPAPEGGAAAGAAASSPARGINQGEVAVGIENGEFPPKICRSLGMPIPARLGRCSPGGLSAQKLGFSPKTSITNSFPAANATLFDASAPVAPNTTNASLVSGGCSSHREIWDRGGRI